MSFIHTGLGNNTFFSYKHFVSFNPKLGKKNSTKLMGGLDHPYFYLFIIGEGLLLLVFTFTSKQIIGLFWMMFEDVYEGQ